MLELDFKVLGAIGTNCYLLKNTQTKECVLIDPADQAQVIIDWITESGYKLCAILLTHGHYDHILAAEEVKKQFGVSLYACEAEKNVLASPQANLSLYHGMQVSIAADEWIADGQKLTLAGISIQAFHTPGHTEGGMCYYVADAGMLFSGDTLFAESVGRTDFPTGSMSAIVRSIKEKLMGLPQDTIVFPGHGESSKIAYEKQYNPYLQG